MALPDNEIPFNLDREMHRWFLDEVELLDRVISTGGCKDFAQYKDLTGQRQGLLKARDRLLELIENWNNRG